MVVFSLACVILVGVALSYVLEPLRHPGRFVATVSKVDANVTVYRRQLAEMKADLAHGLMTAEQFARDREDLEDRLLVELPRYSNAAAQRLPTPRTEPVIYLLGIGLPIAAAVLYYALGNPEF